MEDISIISMIMTAALVLGSLFLVLTPLFKWDAYLQFQPRGQNSSDAKEVLFTTLNEIEFEYKMDKLSESDYKKLKRQYEHQIAKIMKEDEGKVGNDIDPSLMAEVDREIEASIKRNKANKEGVL